jgi:RNA polymerase sigma-70 factor (ECF subfamily)
VFQSVLDREVQEALDGLPQKLRAVVILADLEHLRYAEVAAVLGIAEGTVKSRLSRAREQLRERLLGYAVSHGYVSGPGSGKLQYT